MTHKPRQFCKIFDDDRLGQLLGFMASDDGEYRIENIKLESTTKH